MDDDDLRTGGWTSSGGLLRKAVILVAVLLLLVVIVGPTMVKAPDAEVSNKATYYSSWNLKEGPDSDKLLLGLVKTSTRVYERKGMQSGLLYVVAVNALLPLPGQGLSDLVEKAVEERAADNQIDLDESSRTEGELRIEAGAGYTADTIAWRGQVSGAGGYFMAGKQVRIKAAIWEAENYTIVCVGIGLTDNDLNQAQNLMQHVEEL